MKMGELKSNFNCYWPSVALKGEVTESLLGSILVEEINCSRE